MDIALHGDVASALLGLALAIERLPLSLIAINPDGEVLAANALARKQLRLSEDLDIPWRFGGAGKASLATSIMPCMRAAGRILVRLDLPYVGQCLARAERLHGFAVPSPLVLIEIDLAHCGDSLLKGRQSSPIDPDVQALKTEAARLRRLSQVDRLTGLLNATEFNLRAALLFDRQRDANLSATFLYMDINKFKSINDRFGHDAGDDLLRLTGRRLRSLTPPDGLSGRVGGDEFCMLLAGSCTERTKHLQQILQSPLPVNDSGTVLSGIGACRSVPTYAVGFASSPKDGVAIATLRRAAESRMYADKLGGRNSSRRSSNV